MNASDDLILWGPELMTGVDLIDQQHQVLVDMCNEANRLMQGHVDAEDVKRLVRDLMSYAMYHFEAEEELAIDQGYGESLKPRMTCTVNNIVTLQPLWLPCSKTWRQVKSSRVKPCWVS